MNREIGFAVIGAGGFARFAVSQFVKRDGARLIGAYDASAESIAALKEAHPGIKVYENLDSLLADPGVELVYIGSPPFLHFEQSLAALKAGKNVICEKPAALEIGHAEQLRQCAAANNLLFVVNLMQRYNPLYSAVKALVDDKIFGEFVHGFFENYAADEPLPPDHWFWDDAKSGGIFIEHGVHFFDMFAGWLGRGEVMSAQRLGRHGHPGVWDIAQCEVVYANNAPVHFYHAFNQPRALDRQEMRLQFERGDITLYEWVPNRLLLNAICTQAQVQRVEKLFPSADVTVLAQWESTQYAQGRFKPIEYDRKIRLDTGEIQPKLAVYEALVRAMFDDQVDWLANRSRHRKIDENNAVESLATAVEADLIATRRS